MGKELATTARYRGQSYQGTIYLESAQISFKSPELRWCVPLGAPTTATATGASVSVRRDGEELEFRVGNAAEKWAEKICNPPTRMTKLGVKAGHKIWLSSGFDQTLRSELKQAGAKLTRQLENSQLALLAVSNRQQLGARWPPLARDLPAGVNVWIVWPKRGQEITQADVMGAAQAAGFGPSKTAAFDDQHSSMRFACKRR